MYYHSPEWFAASPVILEVSKAADDISIRIDLNWNMDSSLQVPSVLTLTLKGCSDVEYMMERLQEGIGCNPDYEVFEIHIEDGEIRFYGWWENGEATCEAIEETFSEYTLNDWRYKTTTLVCSLAREVEERQFTERAYFELVSLLTKKTERELDRGGRKLEFLARTNPQKAEIVHAETCVYTNIMNLVMQAQAEYQRGKQELYRSWQESVTTT